MRGHLLNDDVIMAVRPQNIVPSTNNINASFIYKFSAIIITPVFYIAARGDRFITNDLHTFIRKDEDELSEYDAVVCYNNYE